MQRLFHSLRLKNFAREERGNVFIMVAFGIFMLVGAVGTAVDVGRGELVRTKLQNSLDAAGLAAGATVSSSNLNAVVTKYLNVNFSHGILQATVTNVTTTLSSDNMTLNVSATATMPTTFMTVFGKPTMNLAASTQITRANEGLELVLVMDNTGSMNDAAGGGVSKISAAKTAANDLLTILYGNSNTQQNLWIGVVPFSQAVNIGTGYSGWMNTNFDNGLDFGPTASSSNPHCTALTGTTATYTSSLPGCSYATTNNTAVGFGMTKWAGCVLSRSTGNDTSDATPTTETFKAYDYTSTATGTSGTAGCTGGYDSWKCTKSTTQKVNGKNVTTNTTYYDYSQNSSLSSAGLTVYKGPNDLCPQAVTPMVAEKSTVSAAINNMAAGGDTMIDLGLAWGWRLLSPKWRTLWGGEMTTYQLPLDYNTPLMHKVVILMTDGDNHFLGGNYTAYGFLADGNLGSTNETTAESTLNTRTASLCTAMKAQGIIIYTIALGTDISATGQTLLKNCATETDYYFQSPTTDDLETAFQEIGDSLANLRISK